MRTRAYIKYEGWNDAYRFALVHDGADRKCFYLDGMSFKEFPEGGHTEPLDPYKIENAPPIREMLQAIVDAAWDEGFRPKGFSDVKNETTAIKNHLADMRALAFYKVGAPTPNQP